MLFCFKRGVWVSCGGLRALGTAVPLVTAHVWVLYGGDGDVSTGTGFLSAGVGVRRGVAGSLSNWVGVQSARVWVMCGRAGSWASTTMVLSPLTGGTIFSEGRVFYSHRYCHHPLQLKWMINKKSN